LEVRINGITASHFRGIADEMTLDLVSGDRAVSLLLLGDNGTGKSSIVDAIEFGLQGHTGQTKQLASVRRTSIQSFASPALAAVTVNLTNGDSVERHLVKDEEGVLMSDKRPHAAFAVSPFVLRRGDILRFWDAPEAERQLVFWNYLRKPDDLEWHEHPEDELANLRQERLETRIRRDEVIKQLAAKLEKKSSEIPVGRNDFRKFVRETVYKGFSPDEIAKKGIRLRIKAGVEELIDLFLQESAKHTKLKASIREFALTREVKGFPRHLLTAMSGFLASVSERLTESFLAVSPLPFVRRVTVSYGDIGQIALRVQLELTDSRTCSPNQILSEANLDLLALLFFTAVAEESAARGQAKVLVLDDVFQSVDATIRVAFLDFMLQRMADWQLLITVHDRLWHSQARQLFQRHGVPVLDRRIVRWTFEGGPVIRDLRTEPGASLRESRAAGSAVRLCSEAGLLLETIGDQLSFRLPVSVTRRRDDRYTLGDLWPGVNKVLRKTTLADHADEVDRWLHLRNLIGAHHNEWATMVSDSEAAAFAEAVLILLDHVHCTSCGRWVEELPGGASRWICRCGQLDVRSKQVVSVAT
jgi:recombinational DNA repair ATPase RecF